MSPSSHGKRVLSVTVLLSGRLHVVTVDRMFSSAMKVKRVHKGENNRNCVAKAKVKHVGKSIQLIRNQAKMSQRYLNT